MKKVSFTEMKHGTKEDYLFLDKLERKYAGETADRIIKFMSGLTETLEGYQVSRLEHSLQSATKAFNNGESIPKKYACKKRGGENISIPINISNVPENAKSIVLIMDDPDAMSLAGKIWVHWVLFDIPTDVNELPAMKDGKIGIGKSGQNSNYKENYDGPCPPHGMHVYNIKAYALNIEIKESFGALPQIEFEKKYNDAILSSSVLSGKYAILHILKK